MGNVILPMWEQCPAFTRLLCVGYPVLSIVLMILESTPVGWLVRVFFVCNVHTIMKLWLWTLFVGPFYSPISSGMSFLFTIFEIYMVMMYFPHQEQEVGSSVLLCWTLVMNALMNIVYLFVMFLWSLAYRNTFTGEAYLEANSSGLWPLVMLSLTLRCLRDPEGSTSFWGFAQIPNKWYPVCLTAFFCLLSGMHVRWDFVAALAIGYTHGVVQYDRLLPSRMRVRRLEDRCCSSRTAGLLGASWVPVSQTAAYQAEAAGRPYSTLGGPQLEARGRTVQQSSASSSRSPAFAVFAGAGNRLGDGSDLAHPLAPEPAPPQASHEASEEPPQEMQQMPSAPDESRQEHTGP